MTSNSEGGSVVEFIERFCKAKGKRVHLLQWQKALLNDLFEFRADGRWRYRTAYIQLARKNGKTWLMAMAALYVAITASKDAEVYFVAGSVDQAARAFDFIKRAIDDEPNLRNLFTGDKKPQRRVIEVPGTRTVLRVLSSDAGLQLGLEPSFVVADELAVWETDKLWTAMVTGTATREQAMVVGITTPGWRHDNVAHKLYEQGKQTESGELDHPSFFFRCWESSSPDADYRDREVWREANPSLGEFLIEDVLAADLAAVHELDFRRFHLGQWVATAASLISPADWDACAGPVDIPDGTSDVVIALDASVTRNSTAVVTVRPVGDEIHARFEIRTPTPEEPINLAGVEGFIRSELEGFPRATFVFDKHLSVQLAQNLERDGFNVIEIPQSNDMMVPATQKLLEAVNTGKLRHGGDPVARRHALNAGARETERGVRISKMKSSEHVDAIVARAMALEALERRPTKRSSVYESRGVELL
jgi:phage terminase large subunit-like protein